jgi:protein phosphatase
MPLFLDTGSSTHTIALSAEIEAALIVTPEEDAEISHGTLVAVAEGVNERPEPNEAGRDALRALNESYYACPEGWRPERSLAESVAQANRAVLSQGERGRASSLTALVLRHRRWWLTHAGGTRAWLLRDHKLKLLTKDHVTLRVGRSPLPTRGCGLGPGVSADMLNGELAEGDVFVLTTGGVHGTLDAARIMSCLLLDMPAAQTADCLTSRAESAGARGTIAAVVVRVEKLPPETVKDMAENLTALPVIAPPEPGESVDGFHIEQPLHKSRYFRLYRATDQESGSTVVLKFPNPRYAREPDFADGFLREEWIAKRIACPYLAQTLPLRSGRRSALYTAMVYEPGENLAERIKRKRYLTLRESLDYATQLLEALETLHRHGVVHGNVRARDILVDKKQRRLRLLALGSSHVDTLSDMTQSPDRARSSATHLAPELFSGGALSWRSDVYAAGVTLYHMLTGHYPYGRVSNRDEAPSGEMVPASRYNEEVPAWLDAALARACALDAAARFASAADFAQALAAHGETRSSKFRAHAGAEAIPPRRKHQPWEWLAVAVLIGAFVAYLMFAFR